MFKTFNNDLMTKYIKALLADTYLYKIPRWKPGLQVHKNALYIYGENILQAKKDGYPENGEYSNNDKLAPYFRKIRRIYDLTAADTDKYRYISNSSFYDQLSHFYFGEYLRYLRDEKDIDLMLYYNCYCGNNVSNYVIDWTADLKEGKTLYNLSLAKKSNLIKSDTEILSVMIKPNVDYSIFLDSKVPVPITCVAFQNGRVINDQMKGSTVIPYSTPNKPFIFRIDLNEEDAQAAAHLNIFKDYLTLFIQVPKSTKLRVVLEGNYDLTDKPHNKIISKEYLTESNIKETIIPKPNLLNYLNDNILSEKLISYITNYAITSDIDIEDNIYNIKSDVQSYAFNKTLNNKLFENLYQGKLDSEYSIDFKKYIYDMYSKYRTTDNIGFIDAEIEDIINKKVGK